MDWSAKHSCPLVLRHRSIDTCRNSTPCTPTGVRSEVTLSSRALIKCTDTSPNRMINLPLAPESRRLQGNKEPIARAQGSTPVMMLVTLSHCKRPSSIPFKKVAVLTPLGRGKQTPVQKQSFTLKKFKKMQWTHSGHSFHSISHKFLKHIFFIWEMQNNYWILHRH